MASFKEDERLKKAEVLQGIDLIEDIAMRATVEIERNYQTKDGSVFGSSDDLQRNLVAVDNIPNFILGLPVYYVSVDLSAYEARAGIDD